MLEICALASGSNGNCYYIGNEKDAVLIDAGIFHKRLVERTNDAQFDITKIRAVFISHEHTDHIQGIRVISKKLSIPGIFSRQTYLNSKKRHKPDLYGFFEANQGYKFGDISVFPFNKSHDAVDPYSFRVECDGYHIGIMTDIGIVDERIQEEFSKCHYVFLESNYDKDMLWNGDYPIYIKKRVDSEIGHLSNSQALELVKNHASPDLKTIFLSHISFNNNTYELALSTFSELNGKYDIRLTSRERVSEVVRI